jgi:5-methylcytosine-specific restriction endonuclease McrA
MKPYQKTYFAYFGYDEHDRPDCEVCGKIANDLHHIKARGMGGSKHRDNIENIMALCRPCHEFYGDKKQHMDFLIITHQIKMHK